MKVRLLDVNVLIALLDSAHVHHHSAMNWFEAVAAIEGWATCPFTENGFVRIVSHTNYPNLRVTPAMAAGSLARFGSSFPGIYRFWPDEVSLINPDLFDLEVLTGSRQITDTYLAGLAFQKNARLTTFDAGIAWRAVRGATTELVERIVP